MYPTYGSENFTWNGHYGSCEASDAFHNYVPFAGFYVVSKRTDAIRFFKFEQECRDLDGDITCWQYVTTDGMRIIIFND